MNQNQQNPFSGLSNPEKKVKPTIAHKYLKRKAKTAVRISNEHNGDKHVPCVLLDVALQLLDEEAKRETMQFYLDHVTYIPQAVEKGKEAGCCYVDLGDSFGYPGLPSVQELSHDAFNLVIRMEGDREPIVCVEAIHVEEALRLMRLKVISSLSRKHLLDLPDQKHTFWLENEFEALCAKLKIPRRTRAIIEKKKSTREMFDVDRISETPNENSSHDLETK